MATLRLRRLPCALVIAMILLSAAVVPSSARTGSMKHAEYADVNPEDYRLTRERAIEQSSNNLVIVTWANFHYSDFVKNWVSHVTKIGASNFLVGAMDDKLLKILVNENVPCFYMGSGLSTGDFGWGSQQFHKMGREKIHLAVTFTGYGLDLLLVDIDTVWMRNPLPFIERYPAADILSSSDNLRDTTDPNHIIDGDHGLEVNGGQNSAMNIGIMLLRSTTNEFCKAWSDNIDKDEKIWDQNAFNNLARKGGFRPAPEDGLFHGYNSQLKIGVFPVAQFCSGHTFFTQRLYEIENVKPYVVHATFQFSGTNGKKNRMREALLWDADGPRYFDPDDSSGFLTYTPNLPEKFTNMINNRSPVPLSLDDHFELINWQIVEWRQALALADSLNRVLVFPELWCGRDKVWFPHHGKFPGSSDNWLFPFPCPLDHIMQLERSDFDLTHFNFKAFHYRESSFLSNPRLPAHFRLQTLELEMEPQEASGSLNLIQHGVGRAQIMSQPVESIVSALQSAAGSGTKSFLEQWKIINVKNPSLIQLYENADKRGEYLSRIRNMLTVYCCEHPPGGKGAGHIFYDPQFDIIPHTDKVNRVWNEPWVYKLGP